MVSNLGRLAAAEEDPRLFLAGTSSPHHPPHADDGLTLVFRTARPLFTYHLCSYTCKDLFLSPPYVRVSASAVWLGRASSRASAEYVSHSASSTRNTSVHSRVVLLPLRSPCSTETPRENMSRLHPTYTPKIRGHHSHLVDLWTQSARHQHLCVYVHRYWSRMS